MYKRYKNYGGGTHRTYNEQPKFIQIIPLPKELSVQALYREEATGTIKAEQIFLLGLYDTGETAFLSPDPNGVLDDASVFSNFIRYEYGTWRKG